MRHPDDAEPFSGVMFKVETDPYVGRLCYVRVVLRQALRDGRPVLNATKGRKDRVGRILQMHANTPEDDDSDKAQSDIGRAQFTQAFADDADDGGAGVTYRLDGATSVGIAITSYSDTSSSQSGDIASSSYLASRGASAFLQHGMGMLQLQTRFAYSHDRHEQVERDELFGSQDRVSFKGRSMELAQRVGMPVKRDRMVVTPWAELGYESQAADGFSVGEGVTEQTYGDVEVSDMLASFGIDTRLEPLALGGRALLPCAADFPTRTGCARTTTRSRSSRPGSAASRRRSTARPSRPLGSRWAVRWASAKRWRSMPACCCSTILRPAPASRPGSGSPRRGIERT